MPRCWKQRRTRHPPINARVSAFNSEASRDELLSATGHEPTRLSHRLGIEKPMSQQCRGNAKEDNNAELTASLHIQQFYAVFRIIAMISRDQTDISSLLRSTNITPAQISEQNGFAKTYGHAVFQFSERGVKHDVVKHRRLSRPAVCCTRFFR